MSLCSSPYSYFLDHNNSLSLNPEHCSKSLILLFEQYVASLLSFLFEDTNDEYEKAFFLNIAVSAILCLPCISCYFMWNLFSFLCVYGYTQRSNITTKQSTCPGFRARSWPIYLTFWFST